MTRRAGLITIVCVLGVAVLGPAPSSSAATFSARVNFQTQSASVAAGYSVDYGAAYSDSRGYGWISQTSSTPLSLVGNGRPTVSSRQTAVPVHAGEP